jgi:hypothetical protein
LLRRMFRMEDRLFYLICTSGSCILTVVVPVPVHQTDVPVA